jgi:DNA polymerase V
MKIKIDKIYQPNLTTTRHLPYFEAAVSAGFPSPADDYQENKLDLNSHLIKNPAATFIVKVSGDSMEGAGIYQGDLLIVDRSVRPRDKNVVIAVIDGEMTVKRIRIKNKNIYLAPESPHYPTKKIDNSMQFEVWGVVTNVIHTL